MTTKYFDIEHYEVTQSQANNLEYYFIEFEESGILKKIEQYNNGTLLGIVYYAYSLSEMNSLKLKFDKVVINYVYNSGTYLVNQFNIFQTQTLIKKRVKIFKAMDNNLICNVDYDVATDSPIYETCEKYYYDSDGERYHFIYLSDGSCERIMDERYYQSDIWPDEIGVNPNVTFSWTLFSYYEFAYPEVPIGAI